MAVGKTLYNLVCKYVTLFKTVWPGLFGLIRVNVQTSGLFPVVVQVYNID